MKVKTLDLSGVWRGRCVGGRREFPVHIPGDLASALLKEGLIPDPYYGKNELKVQWIGRRDWLLNRRFELDEAEGRSWLHFDSIDTVAEIRLNGAAVAESRNMFRRLRVEVGSVLKKGSNVLEILIRSPEATALKEAEKLPYPVPCATHFPWASPHKNLVRKVQCHGGWDWGPALMTGGLYGRVELHSGTGRIEYVHTRQRPLEGNLWNLEISTEYLAYQDGSLELTYTFDGITRKQNHTVKTGLQTLNFSITVNNPRLWWPAGHGEQNLYDLEVAGNGETSHKRMGFRSVEVLNEEDERGRGMTFRVNGREIFAKGANWIPVDALPSRQTDDAYRRLLGDAASVHMNMIRLWGGGQYERDIFYNLCDELGLMIWHDMMFACSLYPTTQDFMADVEEEIRHQIKRLKDHPSIVLWCGNNESLGALGWFEESRKNRDRYLVDYDRLNEGVVGRVVRELDADRTWWPSSPSAGEGDYSDCWHEDNHGDMHYWSVWHEGLPFESYYDVTPRFCSEFGFQSFPSPAVVAAFAPREEWNVTSPVMRHHQKNDRGNSIILSTMARYFRMPLSFGDFLYLSQVQQSYAIRMAVEYWRSRRPLCMGALYWQLNDNWPAASWSSIEYDGSWKLLHYEASRFFRPVWMALSIKDGAVCVHGINDGTEGVGGRVILRFLDFLGSVRQTLTLEHETVDAGSAREFSRIPLPKKPEDRFLTARWELGGEILENYLFLAHPRDCALEEPDIRISPSARPGVLKLETDRPAFFVQLETETVGRFEDAGFILLPGAVRELAFLPAEGHEIPKDLAAGTTLRHLQGTFSLPVLKPN